MAATTNVTVRVDDDVKREFDNFCEGVGMNVSTAINMFMRAVLRTRQLPFTVTDVADDREALLLAKNALKAMQDQSLMNGNVNMTLDEINAEITQARNEKIGLFTAQGN